MDITGNFRQKVLLFDEQGLVAALKDVTGRVMAGVEVLGIGGVEALHDLGEIGLSRLEEQKRLVAHQAVGVDLEPVALLVRLEE
jgi:hypothetical protein